MPQEETCNDVMSEERRKKAQLEEKMNPKRECPVPKPGGLIGQVLGLKEAGEDVERISIRSRVESARKEAQSKKDDQ